MTMQMTDTTSNINGLPDGQESPAPVEGELLQRRRHRRRNDLHVLHGIRDEQIRLHYLLMADKIPLGKYEVASRGLGRLAITAEKIEELERAADIQRRLEALQQQRQPAAALTAPTPRENPPPTPAWAEPRPGDPDFPKPTETLPPTAEEPSP